MGVSTIEAKTPWY